MNCVNCEKKISFQGMLLFTILRTEPYCDKCYSEESKRREK